MAGSGPGPESVAGGGGRGAAAKCGPPRPGVLRHLGPDRRVGWSGGSGRGEGAGRVGGGAFQRFVDEVSSTGNRVVGGAGGRGGAAAGAGPGRRGREARRVVAVLDGHAQGHHRPLVAIGGIQHDARGWQGLDSGLPASPVAPGVGCRPGVAGGLVLHVQEVLRHIGFDREVGWGGGFGGTSGRRVLGGGDEEGESGEGREVRWEGKAGWGGTRWCRGRGQGLAAREQGGCWTGGSRRLDRDRGWRMLAMLSLPAMRSVDALLEVQAELAGMAVAARGRQE